MMTQIKEFVKRLMGLENYDRMVERKVLRSVDLYHRGGRLNVLRAQRMCNKIRKNYNVCIWPSATIGKNFYLAHGHDVTIGRTTIIGDNCKVYPFFYTMATVVNDRDLIKAKQRRHALIGNDCICGAKATVIGPVTIGDDVTIGACAIVTKDVPSHSVVKGLNQIRPKRIEEIPEKYHAELEVTKVV